MSLPEPKGSELERTPPHDLNAEQCVLGGMMLSQDAITEVIEILRSQDFYRPAHQVIYDAILDIYGRGEPADAVTVSAELTKKGEATRTGGAPYLGQLINTVPTAANAGYYAKIVQERSILRKLVEAGTRIVQLGYAANADADDLLDQAQAEVYAIADKRTEQASGGETMAELFPRYLDHLEAQDTHDYVQTGWLDLDCMLGGGLRPGQLVVVGARPRIGKSVFLLNTALHVAIQQGMQVHYASLEMSKMELMDRAVSHRARVALHALRTKKLTDADWARIGKSMVDDSEWLPVLFIDEDPNLNITRLRAQLRARAHRGVPARLVVVDYLQLMSTGKRAENRQVEVSQLSRSLKVLAKEFGVPVIVASQLNRMSEQRTDKAPALSDIRESGAVEQDADIVILLHREDAHDKESPRAGEIDLIVAKHRNGPTGTVTCAFQGHYSRIADMASPPREWAQTSALALEN